MTNTCNKSGTESGQENLYKQDTLVNSIWFFLVVTFKLSGQLGKNRPSQWETRETNTIQESKGGKSRNDATTPIVLPFSSRIQILNSLKVVLSCCLHIYTENYTGCSVVFNQVKLHHNFVQSLKCSTAHLVNKSHLKGFNQSQSNSNKVGVQHS